MIDNERLLNLDAEIELLESLMEGTSCEKSSTPGYQGDNFHVSNYLEMVNEDNYEKEVVADSMQALANLLNNAEVVVFEELPANTDNPAVLQAVAESGRIFLRKTTTIEFSRGEKGPGYRTVYDVLVRSAPRIQVK